MKTRKNINFIFELLVPAFYLAAGIVVIILGIKHQEEYMPILLGSLLIAGSFCRLYKFMVNRHFFDVHNIDLSFSLISIAMGFIFIFTDDITLVCLIWGIYEIINGGIELSTDLREVPDNGLMWVSVFISLGEIVFGTLLCIHKEEGILLHLLFMGITFILTGALVIVELIHNHKKNKATNE